ncbi:hypothetical protein [Anthocerotibacter panamensis]|uniref:hypothetical protein n=1 Tax=Anthocerotibacter panamensis TaxID=2857077 RepID=UPI001C4037B8|nr:hypothetical protein [Anthocerotibacter panamensis]
MSEPEPNTRPTVPNLPPELAPKKITLWTEIEKGRDWVVFVWNMLKRLGGVRGVLHTLGFLVTLLVQRALVNSGFVKKKN